MSRVILITGGNGGLGLSMAKSFLDEDSSCHVYLGVRESKKGADALAEMHPERCFPVPLEVTDATQWESAVEGIVDKSGSLDVLVNNAGHHQDQLLAMMSDQQWSEVVDASLRGAFLGSRAVIKPMTTKRKGRIINISSLSALLAPAGQTNYAAAKAGMIAMGQSLAKEVARLGITVNAVCPGYIETAALSEMSDVKKQEIIRGIPMRRLGKATEVAAAVRFLTSDEAAYITGSVLKIDGGIF